LRLTSVVVPTTVSVAGTVDVISRLFALISVALIAAVPASTPVARPGAASVAVWMVALDGSLLLQSTLRVISTTCPLS
jgi:hypothetical protein